MVTDVLVIYVDPGSIPVMYHRAFILKEYIVYKYLHNNDSSKTGNRYLSAEIGSPCEIRETTIGSPPSCSGSKNEKYEKDVYRV